MLRNFFSFGLTNTLGEPWGCFFLWKGVIFLFALSVADRMRPEHRSRVGNHLRPSAVIPTMVTSFCESSSKTVDSRGSCLPICSLSGCSIKSLTISHTRILSGQRKECRPAWASFSSRPSFLCISDLPHVWPQCRPFSYEASCSTSGTRRLPNTGLHRSALFHFRRGDWPESIWPPSFCSLLHHTVRGIQWPFLPSCVSSLFASVDEPSW